ncbi:MAG: ATP synthase F1 subunit gamma [Ignavibacteriae bacterium]|nr:ATP synthase F1 subunit gamma [Ignavibacteriota bacterium]MCB9220666.1 ATP synthase F1 subunit gamma [Ignavibacteria bacterium]
MANLRELKRRISGVKNTAKITQAMKMVSAAKLKRAQKAIESARPYVLKMQEILGNVIAGIGEDYENPLLKEREVKNIALVIVGSDKGLCGSFNANIFKTVNSFIKDEIKVNYPEANIQLISVGNKTVSKFSKTNLNVTDNFKDVFGTLEFSSAQKIIKTFVNKFVSAEVDKVYVIFNEFINVIRQEVKVEQLLPIDPANLSKGEADSNNRVSYIFEPNEKEIMDELLPKLLNISLWRTLLESNAAENASRMMAMDNATTNANDLVSELNLKYNKERQAAITTEMLEIVGGAEALNK